MPYYNPTWAYGPWPYPAYPPVYYPPPPELRRGLLATGMMFGLGVAAGAAMFGGWNWGWSGAGCGNSYTTVNVNRATNIDQQLQRNNINPTANGSTTRASQRRALSRQRHPRAVRPACASGRRPAPGVPRPARRDNPGAGNRPAARQSPERRQSRRSQSCQRNRGNEIAVRNRGDAGRPTDRRQHSRQREPWWREPRPSRRQPRQRRSIARPTAATRYARTMRSYIPEAAAAGTAAAAMAADMEAGDERHNAPARPVAPVRPGLGLAAPRDGAQQAPQTPGLPDRRSGGERLTEAVRKDDDKAIGGDAGRRLARLRAGPPDDEDKRARRLISRPGTTATRSRRRRQGDRRGRHDRLRHANPHRQGRRRLALRRRGRLDEIRAREIGRNELHRGAEPARHRRRAARVCRDSIR